MPPVDAHTESTLTPEERAAIAPEDDKSQVDALRAVAGDASDAGEDDAGEDEDDADEGGDDPAGAAAAPAAPAEPAPAPAAAAAPAAADEPDPDTPPVYTVKLPDDYQQRVDANAAARQDVRAKRDAGELSIEEYDREVEKLDDERDELRALKMRADVAEDMTRQAQLQALRKQEARIVKLGKGQGLDYAGDPQLQSDFNSFFDALAGNPKSAGKPLAWLYDEAHKRVALLHGVQAQPTPAAPSPAPSAADKKKAAEAARTPGPAQTNLANMPGGEGPGDIDGDEFADLDALQGLALEDAIAARMRRDPSFAEKFTSRLPGNGPRRNATPH